MKQPNELFQKMIEDDDIGTDDLIKAVVVVVCILAVAAFLLCAFVPIAEVLI